MTNKKNLTQILKKSVKIIEETVKKINTGKKYLDWLINPALGFLATEGSLLYGLYSIANSPLDDTSKTIISSGYGIISIKLNKKFIVPLLKKLYFKGKDRLKQKELTRKESIVSWLETLLFSFLIYTTGIPAINYTKSYINKTLPTQIEKIVELHGNNIKKFQKKEKNEVKEVKNKSYGIGISSLRNTKKIDQTNKNLEERISSVKLADKETDIGRIQRTLRWKTLTNYFEKKYGIPHGYLLGIIAQESYGDPIQPNKGLDGGLGLVHFQPGTAKEYGLNVYGNDKGTVNKRHGKKIKNLIKKVDYNLYEIAERDDRANPYLNLEATAKYLIDNYKKIKTWEKNDKVAWELAVESINVGLGNVGRKRGWKYLNKVKKYKNALFDKNRIKEAEEDFNKRNKGIGITFNEYINYFSDFCKRLISAAELAKENEKRAQTLKCIKEFGNNY